MATAAHPIAGANPMPPGIAKPAHGIVPFHPDAAGAESAGGLQQKRIGAMHWQRCGRLPMKLLVTIPLPALSLRDLLSLEMGQLLLSSWSARDDVPLLAGDIFLANVTFEAASAQLGVRISSFQRKPQSQQPSILPVGAKATQVVASTDRDHTLSDIRLPVSLLFGSKTMPVQEVLDLTSGDAIILERAVHAPVSVLAGRRIVAQGELVAVRGFYGVRLTKLAELSKRLPESQ